MEMTADEWYEQVCKERKHHEGIIIHTPMSVSATYIEAQMNEDARKALAWAKDQKALEKLKNIDLWTPSKSPQTSTERK